MLWFSFINSSFFDRVHSFFIMFASIAYNLFKDDKILSIILLRSKNLVHNVKDNVLKRKDDYI